ncbi:hypothetical protein [Cryptosporangium aurantiacum]|uniref:Uncharacterized protein n=1 Tax=Cryptosporangium aurantiacum TaxID=134849 RepID=A0A1M7P9N0_9ACTN|nr:hypothetical protein [Cryptosporangium aurantiacum]SHN13434.1 hypothetical protein SAMN05443668_10395 [Cryptosporangium aurantiacum]
MDTVESQELWISPFAGGAVDSAREAEIASEGFGAVASPFAEASADADSQEAAEATWQSLAADLADESFDEALEDLVDEAAARYLHARARVPLADGAADPATQEVEAWLTDRAEAVDQALARLQAEYGDRRLSEDEAGMLADSVGSAGESPSAATEQFLGGLVRKAVKVAKAGIKVLGKVIPMGQFFGLIRRIAPPLLKGVLDKALGRLPASQQEPARLLAAKLGLREAETDEAFSLGETFDQELAQLLLAPTDGRADELLAEFEHEEYATGPDPLSELDRARATLTEQLAAAERGRPPIEELEQFIPAVMAAMPLLRAGFRFVPRDRVVGFLGKQLAPLIEPHIGPVAAKALAPRIADTGLRLLSLEAEAPERLGAEALADTVEETVRTVLELPPASLADPLRLRAATDLALAEAAGRLLPASVLRSDLETFESDDQEATWVLMPRRTSRCRRYRAYGRVFDVTISRPQARAIVLRGEDTLEERLQEAGVERWPVNGEVRLYEAIPGTREGHLSAFESEAGLLEELTPETATLLLGRPGLGRRLPTGAPRFAPGRRLFRLVVPGRALKRRRPRLVVRFAAANRPAVRLHLRLGERSSGILAGHLTKQAYPEALATVTRLVGPVTRRQLAGKVVLHLRRALGAAVPPARGETLADHLVESALRTLSAQLPGSAAAILAAIRDPAQGITLTFTSTFTDRQALQTGESGESTLTVRAGRHHD